MSQKELFVVHHDSGWAVRRPDAQRSSALAPTQAEAIELARELENLSPARVLGGPGHEVGPGRPNGRDSRPVGHHPEGAELPHQSGTSRCQGDSCWLGGALQLRPADVEGEIASPTMPLKDYDLKMLAVGRPVRFNQKPNSLRCLPQSRGGIPRRRRRSGRASAGNGPSESDRPGRPRQSTSADILIACTGRCQALFWHLTRTQSPADDRVSLRLGPRNIRSQSERSVYADTNRDRVDRLTHLLHPAVGFGPGEAG